MNFKAETRFCETIAAFDSLNSQDPNLIEVNGEAMPKELHDAFAMTRWVETLDANASEAVHLAARCQHLCRWEVPRSSYPEGRQSYLRWRADLKVRHAKKSAEILNSHGYDSAMVDAVSRINMKTGIKSNEEVQLIEDALCLVFLECQFEAYLDKWEDDKIIRILQKTWAKMSDRGHAAALQLKMSDRASALVQQALA
ncbi:DUF4202 domain-containing protein [Coraliomargarita sp. W4R72]